MSRKKRAKTQERRRNAHAARLPKALSRARRFFARHRVATILSGAIALLGSLASIYALSAPDIVAISPSKTFNGTLQAAPGDGLAIWIEIEQRFKNVSWRGGGNIGGLRLVPHSLDTATWLSNKVVNSNSETFAAREEKIVKSTALFQLPEIKLGKKYPQFVVDIQFLDQNGAIIKEASSGKPYSFPFTITESALNSLKASSGTGR